MAAATRGAVVTRRGTETGNAMAVLLSLGSAGRWRGRRAPSHSPHSQMRITRRPSSQSLTFVGYKKSLLPQAETVVAVAPILCCWRVRASLARSLLRKAKRPCPLNVPLSLPPLLCPPPLPLALLPPSLPSLLSPPPPSLPPSASYVSTAHAKIVTVLGSESDTHLDAVDVGLACLRIGSLTVTFDLGARLPGFCLDFGRHHRLTGFPLKFSLLMSQTCIVT